MNMIVKRKVGNILKEMAPGDPFVFLLNKNYSGIYIRVASDNTIFSISSGQCLVVKIADEADRDAALGITKSMPMCGSVIQCDTSICVLPLHTQSLPTLYTKV